MELGDRVERVRRFSSELVTVPELEALFSTNDHPRAYIGFEPSGRLHVGQLVTARKMLDLIEAGCRLDVFLADWHAWINEKLGGDLDRIRASGRAMEAVYTALGVDPSRVRYRWATDLCHQEGYWERVIRVAKATSLSRSRRAMSILGRGEEEAQLDTAKLFYPSMQAADIFELPVEIAVGGMDQRRAHVLAREVAHHYHWPAPVAVHTPLISSLNGGKRMDAPESDATGKMSKSDPSTAVLLPSSRSEVETKLNAAFCPPKKVEGNPVLEIARWVTFPWEGHLAIERPTGKGGPVDFTSEPEFVRAWTNGEIHPQDLKRALVESLDRLMEPVRKLPPETWALAEGKVSDSKAK